MKLAIILEGVDCSGKSTIAKALKEKLDALKLNAIVNSTLTHECAWMRDLILSGKYRLSPEEKATMFSASFIKDFERLSEQVDENTVVLFDRFIASTFAYNTNTNLMYTVGNHLKGIPVLQIYVDVDEQTRKSRLSIKVDKDAHESDFEYIEHVYNKYKTGLLFANHVIGKMCETYVINNSDGTKLEDTVDLILSHVNRLLTE